MDKALFLRGVLIPSKSPPKVAGNTLPTAPSKRSIFGDAIANFFGVQLPSSLSSETTNSSNNSSNVNRSHSLSSWEAIEEDIDVLRNRARKAADDGYWEECYYAYSDVLRLQRSRLAAENEYQNNNIINNFVKNRDTSRELKMEQQRGGDSSVSHEGFMTHLEISHTLIHMCRAMGYLNAKFNFNNKTQVMREALSFQRTALGNSHMLIANTLRMLGKMYCKSRNYESASHVFEEELLITMNEMGNDAIDTAHCHDKVGMIYYKLQKYDDSILHLKEAHRIYSSHQSSLEKSPLSDNNKVNTTKSNKPNHHHSKYTANIDRIKRVLMSQQIFGACVISYWGTAGVV